MYRLLIIALALTQIYSSPLAHAGNESSAECHVDGNYGRVGYTADVLKINSGDASHIEYAVKDIKLAWVESESRSLSSAELTAIKIVATIKPSSGLGRADVIWYESFPIKISLSNNSTTAKVGDIKFVVPADIYNRADHIGITFSNEDELWPVDLELKLLNKGLAETYRMCPGIP